MRPVVACCLPPPEVVAAAGVDDGVHAGVDPAEPVEDSHDERGEGAGLADAGNGVDDEEGEPADDEDPHHNTECCGCLLLFSKLVQLLADRRLGLGLASTIPPGRRDVVRFCRRKLLQFTSSSTSSTPGTEIILVFLL